MPIHAPIENNLYQLLSLVSTSKQFNEFLSTELNPEISKLSKYVYYAYKQLGLSFCFIHDEKEDLILDAIDVYNGKTQDGFEQYNLPHNLPNGLTTTMQAHEIVTELGEPDRKGGGGQSRVPCWIEYKFNSNGNQQENKDSGILIQLHGFDWEDREMGWTSFIIY